MNIKTILLYAGLVCSGYGTAVIVLPSQADVEQARMLGQATVCEDTGRTQSKGRPPIRSKAQEF